MSNGTVFSRWLERSRSALSSTYPWEERHFLNCWRSHVNWPFEWKLIFIRKTSHLDSFWRGGISELGNGLLKQLHIVWREETRGTRGRFVNAAIFTSSWSRQQSRLEELGTSYAGKKYQMERKISGISEFPEKRTTSGVFHLQKISGNFCGNFHRVKNVFHLTQVRSPPSDCDFTR